jgi:hypothetical protein
MNQNVVINGVANAQIAQSPRDGAEAMAVGHDTHRQRVMTRRARGDGITRVACIAVLLDGGGSHEPSSDDDDNEW